MRVVTGSAVRCSRSQATSNERSQPLVCCHLDLFPHLPIPSSRNTQRCWQPARCVCVCGHGRWCLSYRGVYRKETTFPALHTPAMRWLATPLCCATAFRTDSSPRYAGLQELARPSHSKTIWCAQLNAYFTVLFPVLLLALYSCFFSLYTYRHAFHARASTHAHRRDDTDKGAMPSPTCTPSGG